MSKGVSVYKNTAGAELYLAIDVDLQTQTIQELFFKGTLNLRYQSEIEELKALVKGVTIAVALGLKRGSLKSEIRLQNGKLPLASLSLWLLHRAIEDYLGTAATLSEQNDLLCLCYGIGLRELKTQILTRSDYDLKTLVAETNATSACGSCLPYINKAMKNIREEHGMILGLDHSESRFDKAGHWLKVKDLYPAALLIKLDDLKKQWMVREGITDLFEIEITRIEGYHLWLKVLPDEDLERATKVIEALNEYWRSEIGVLFFLHLELRIL